MKMEQRHRRPPGSIACDFCRGLLWYLVYLPEPDTYRLECRNCSKIGPPVNLEAGL